ncbi:hypothetical protein V6Z12_D11G140400 [Gossypium hirsutum]
MQGEIRQTLHRLFVYVKDSDFVWPQIMRFCLAIMTQDYQPQDLRSSIVFWCSTR